MKKLVAFLFILVLVLVFVGCEEIREELFGDTDDASWDSSESSGEDQTYWQTPVNPTVETGPFRLKETTGPLYNGVVQYAGNRMRLVVDVPAKETDSHITVSTGDANVICVRGHYAYANRTEVNLEFNQAGESTLTFTLEETGEAVTYHITVKEDYECNPGPGELTPEEFVYCVTEIAKANGMTLMSSTPKCYANMALDDYKLTWEYARSMAEQNCRQWWREGYRCINFIYRGVYPAGNMFRAYLSA